MGNPYNLGFGVYGGHSLDKLIGLTKRAEAAGLTSCWIFEDYFFGGAFSTAAAIATNTKNIQIGIGVINPYTRHPVLSAMEAASLDAISDKRLILGLGASNKRWIQDLTGIPYEKPITATKEATIIIKQLIRDRKLKFEGEVFKTGEIHLDFEPCRPDLPVYLGVKGPQFLQLAGEVADGLILSVLSSVPYVGYVREQIKIGAERVGRDPNEVKLVCYFAVHMDEDGQKARDAVRPLLAKFIGIHGNHPIMFTAGLSEEQIKPFREATLAGNFEAMIPQVTDDMIDKLAIVGTPDEVKAKLKAANDAGVDMPVALEVLNIDPETTMDLITKYIVN